MTYSGVKGLLVPFYEGHLTATRVVTELPSNLETQVPLLQVVGISDLAHSVAPMRYRLIRWVLQTFAAGDVAAEAFAETVLQVTMTALQGASLTAADVSFVGHDSGPAPVPYPDTQVRQYAMSFNGRVLLH